MLRSKHFESEGDETHCELWVLLIDFVHDIVYDFSELLFFVLFDEVSLLVVLFESENHEPELDSVVAVLDQL